MDKGISNITENWIEIQFEDQEKRISAEMNVATSTESLSVPLLSGSLSSSEQERNKLFTGSYGDNLRNILSVSTSVIIPGKQTFTIEELLKLILFRLSIGR